MSEAYKPLPVPVQQTRILAVAPFEGFDRTATIAVPQELVDDQLAQFTEGELKIMLSIIRATNSGQRTSIPLSVRVLCQGGLPEVVPGKGTGLSPRTVQAACTALEAAGFLRVQRRMAPDGSGLPSLFSLPLIVPGMSVSHGQAAPRFPGYQTGRRVRLPLLIIDRLIAELSGAELKVLLYVLRHTFCVGLADDVMPMSRLVENTGLSLRHTRLAANTLFGRGIILVHHRQDPERGKLPSSFGVRVLGERAPFTPIPSPGTITRPRAEEPQAEAPRPVWLVSAEPSAPIPGDSALEHVATSRTPIQNGRIVDNAVPLALDPALSSSQSDVLSSPHTLSAPAAGAGVPSRIAPTPVGRRQVPAAMTQDPDPVWASVKRILADRLPYQTFVERIANTTTVGSGGAELLVAVQNEHHRWWLESKLGNQVRAALDEAGHSNRRLRYLNYDRTSPVAREPGS